MARLMKPRNSYLATNVINRAVPTLYIIASLQQPTVTTLDTHSSNQFNPSLHNYKLVHLSLAVERLKEKLGIAVEPFTLRKKKTCTLLRVQGIAHVYLDVLLAARGVKSSAEVSADG